MSQMSTFSMSKKVSSFISLLALLLIVNCSISVTANQSLPETTETTESENTCRMRLPPQSFLTNSLKSAAGLFSTFTENIFYTDTRNMSDWKDKSSVYEFTVKDIDGNDVSLEKYRGHPLIIVNVATHCGLTKSNYKQLNQLYDQFEKDGLRIAAFPCNQFGGQEPGCDVDIKEFALKNGVKFDMYAKINVNGDSADPLYKWLKHKQGGTLFDAIKWNFTKFLLDKEGIPIKRYAPTLEPEKIEPDIRALL